MLLSQGLVLLPGCSSSVNALSSRDAGTDGAASRDSVGEPSSAAETGPQNCSAQAGGPAAVDPAPSVAQAAYQRDELTAYIHFGLETFDGTEQGDSSKDVPGLFNPTNLDANQWVTALKDAGFRQVTLTVKHGTGFCLWPSKSTDFSVKASPWKNGQGDVVREFTDAMHAADMSVGLYLSPLDQHYPSSSPTYDAYFRSLLIELLSESNYGIIDQLHFDGYNAPKSLDWKGIVQLAKQLQPDMLVWMGPEIATSGADLRWNGNQVGQSSRSTSSIGDIPNGGPKNTWYPAEAPVSVHLPDWFWHPNATTVSLKSLQTMYLQTVGANTTLRLSVPPSTAGLLDAADVNLLQGLGKWHESLYKTNLLQGQPLAADSTWADPGFAAAKVLDDNVCTYWAAASGKTSGRIEVTPTSPITFNLISIREPIALGERATAYHVEIKQNGAWNRTILDASGTQVQGTVIGQRQLWQLNATTADGIALVIDAAKDVPAIAEFGVY